LCSLKAAQLDGLDGIICALIVTAGRSEPQCLCTK
jgi:hypothetical protein